MYDARDVVKKALKDAKKGKLVSIYGAKANMSVKMGKLMSTKQIMNVWVKQQKLDKKYK